MASELGTDPHLDSWQPVSADRYRRVLSRFATGVTIVTTHTDERDHAMTATAFTSVSLEPPLILVCVEKRARFHNAVLRCGWWAVSILAQRGEQMSQWLATRGRPVDAQLTGVDYARGRTGCAVLSDAVAWLECRTWAEYNGGDHTILVGEVVDLDVVEPAVGEAASFEGVPDERHEKIAPLLHYRGEYRRFEDR